MIDHTIPSEFSFRTRSQDWQCLKDNPTQILNVVIIGGGIVGAGIARELGLQGMQGVFLFEKDDFASATSGRSSKLIHAGIRYLEQVWIALKNFNLLAAYRNFKFVMEASQERKILGRLAPHLIQPKRIYLILGADDKRSALSVLMGVCFYYLLQILQGQFFTPPTMAFRKKILPGTAPEIDRNKVKAIFSFWDSETDDARLVIELLQNAHDHGIHALNYMDVLDFEKREDHIRLHVKDRETGETLSLKTKILINATGPFLDEMRRREKGGRVSANLIERVAGSHLDVYPPLTHDSYYITASDTRLVFVLRRNEDGIIFTRIGTTERPLKESESSDDPQPSRQELDYLKALVMEFFPQADLSPERIIRTDAGIRPLRIQEEQKVFLKTREHEIIREDGVYHIIGVKLTDFRRVACELLKTIPWDHYGLKLNDLNRSKNIPLRAQPRRNRKMYAEADLGEIIRRTMVLHWRDYYERRRGAGPRILAHIAPDTLHREFGIMRKIMGWNDTTAENEKKLS
ncbi:MAG: FAD-dependent oxidoreductase [Elusimicrobia bacterium]|nr:FAD-dependent oxidoreductase [Candidatus Obscuribacterium magneticum]